ncbi:MAG: YdcF family protein [Bacillota bacterium]
MRRLLLVLSIFIVAIVGVLYASVEVYGNLQKPVRAEAIIILGAAVWKDGPSPALQERISLAETLYRGGYAPAIITTGGTGTYNTKAEGVAAMEELVTGGIPRDHIYIDATSSNTRENLINAMEIMQEHDWHSAILVSHDFHLLRAVRLARRLGMEVSGAGVQETQMWRVPMVVREILANLYAL